MLKRAAPVKGLMRLKFGMGKRGSLSMSQDFGTISVTPRLCYCKIGHKIRKRVLESISTQTPFDSSRLHVMSKIVGVKAIPAPHYSRKRLRSRLAGRVLGHESQDDCHEGQNSATE